MLSLALSLGYLRKLLHLLYYRQLCRVGRLGIKMQASRIAAAVIHLDTVPLAVPWDLRQYRQVAAHSVDFSRLANASPFVLPICHANLALIFTTLNINGYFLQKWDQLVLFI